MNAQTLKKLEEVREKLEEGSKLYPPLASGEDEDFAEICKDEAKDVVRQAGKFNQAVQKGNPKVTVKELWMLVEKISNFIYNAEEVDMPLKDYAKAKKALQALSNGIGRG
jgi:wyosine [tRNA(Phe)-imidazoG37] synthetase (radical SAM superfamily)